MDSRGLLLTQATGTSVDSTCEAEALLPTVPAANQPYVRIRHSIGGGRCRTTMFLGDISNAADILLAPTTKRSNGLKALPVSLVHGTGGQTLGWTTSGKLMTWPIGKVRILNTAFRCYISALVKTSATDIATTFGGVIALGSAPSTDGTALTTTLGNIIPSTTFSGAAASAGTLYLPATYSIKMVTAQKYTTISTLLDNSGGTASNTIATFATGATVLAAHQNAIASLSAKVDEIIGLLTGANPASTLTAPSSVILDGTTTAISPYFNMLISDTEDGDTAAQNMYVEGRIVFDWEYIDPLPITITKGRPEGQG